MGRLKISAVLFLAYFFHVVQCSSILALFSSLSHSDHSVFRGLVSKLVQKGHNVVMMTPYPGYFGFPDVDRIVELDVGQESAPYWDEFTRLWTNTDDYYTRLRAINEFNVKLAIAQLRSKQMTALFINPNIKFNLVITEADVPLLYAVAEKYKAPHIAITTSSGKIHQHENKGNPVHPMFYPDVNTLNYRNLTFWQKLTEYYRFFQTRNEYYYNYLPLCEVAAKKIFNLKRDLLEVERDIDVLFVTANPILFGNRPTGPATVFTDRLHINPGLSLPQELQTVLNEAKKGAIYFSIGAIQESENLAPNLMQTLADTFKELPYTVLWKIGNTTGFVKPDNVIAQPWFPQQEVLAHPNVKAFITHGGPRSLEEALFYEVPIVGLPIVKSRKVFMREITKYGAGEILDPYNLNKESLKAKILLVAGDKTYKNAMSNLKDKVVDNVISGPEHAVWWTEYVIRNNGAKILRSPVVDYLSPDYLLWDIIGICLGGILISASIVYICLRRAIRKVRERFQKKKPEGGKFKAL